MKRFILMAAMTFVWLVSWAQESAKSDYVSDQIIRQKVIDNGGKGHPAPDTSGNRSWHPNIVHQDVTNTQMRCHP